MASGDSDSEERAKQAAALVDIELHGDESLENHLKSRIQSQIIIPKQKRLH